MSKKRDIPCKHCGKVMSLYACQPRIYCSVKCRAADPDWRNAHSSSIKGIAAWNKGRIGRQNNHNVSGLLSVRGISWNKGVKGLQEAWNKNKKCPQFSGDKNPNWRGGISTENNLVRTSIEYSNWRKSVYERDNYTCQGCGKVGGELHAHHIKPFATNPELRLELSNGVTLCQPCHNIIHKGTSIRKNKAA